MVTKKCVVLALVASMFATPVCVLAEPDEEIVIEETPELITDETEECIESLMDTRPGTFCRSHIVVVDAVSDPSATHVKLFNPDFADITKYKLAKNKSTWNEVKVLRHTKRRYSAGLKFDNKYEGCRTHVMGILLENILGLTEHYEGTLLLDEYKQYPLWNIILNNREEVSDFLAYLVTNLAKQGKRSFDRKPVLLLSLKEDPYLETLTPEDIAQLNSLFEVVDYQDAKTTEFFTKTQLMMDNLIMRFESGNPVYPSEGVRKKLFRKFEKFFKDFDIKEMAPWIIAGATSVFIGWYFQEKILNALRNKIPGPFDNQPQNT